MYELETLQTSERTQAPRVSPAIKSSCRISAAARYQEESHTKLRDVCLLVIYTINLIAIVVLKYFVNGEYGKP